MRDVEEMMQMGFSQNECIEAYMVCDKNKEQAINFLLDGKFN
jgi:UV excision repair protein RAD23